ncbi:MAG: glycosyltransferase family 2 protein, partial [Planctomycetota bacterium]
LEVIVVDNGSHDGSAEAVEEHFPDVIVIRQEKNLGFSGGVNCGFDAATAPLVLLLNTDTLVVGDAIPKLIEYANEHPEAGVIGPRVLNRDETLQSSYFRFPSLTNLVLSSLYLYKLFPTSSFFNRERYAGRDPMLAGPVDVVSGCCFLIRRQLLDQIGGLDEGYFMYAEETDLCARAHAAGYEVHYAPGPEIIHFGGGSSRLASRRMFIQFRRSLLRFYALHRGVAASLAARSLLLFGLFIRLPYWLLRSLLPKQTQARGQLSNILAAVFYLLSFQDAASITREARSQKRRSPDGQSVHG